MHAALLCVFAAGGLVCFVPGGLGVFAARDCCSQTLLGRGVLVLVVGDS